jgi:Ca2+-binding EF-hand superfamily protein
MMLPHERQEAQAWFAAIDRDRSGSITANEIAACTFANTPLGWDTASKLVRVFDKVCNYFVAFEINSNQKKQGLYRKHR